MMKQNATEAKMPHRPRMPSAAVRGEQQLGQQQRQADYGEEDCQRTWIHLLSRECLRPNAQCLMKHE